MMNSSVADIRNLYPMVDNNSLHFCFLVVHHFLEQSGWKLVHKEQVLLFHELWNNYLTRLDWKYKNNSNKILQTKLLHRDGEFVFYLEIPRKSSRKSIKLQIKQLENNRDAQEIL
ncbi:hypothetical protein I4U23_017260 [Adineta vaga]|nr:hypothetical protein I4U23_017260 [Adineta vaga]